jgi:hypothetical protein
MKKFLVVLMTATFALSSTIISLAGEWKQTGHGWWYDNGNGSYTINNWQKVDNKWFHFNQDGYMSTGWVSISGKWYYCNANGEMAHDTWVDGKYYVGSDGAMYVNTTTPDGKKVDQTGLIMNNNSTTSEYSEFIGTFSDGSYDETGKFEWFEELTITKIENGKIYGIYNPLSNFYTLNGDFSNGVAITNNIFTITVDLIDHTNNDTKSTYTATFELGKRDGKPVLLPDDNNSGSLVIYNKVR